MVEQSVESPVVQPGERAKTLAALEILLRIVRQAVDCFPGDDLETIIVYLSVAVGANSRHLRDPAILALMAEEPIPDHLHRPISARALAHATGLPRETVRRRVEALVAAGRLTRKADGVRTGAGELTKGNNLEFIRFLIHEMDTATARVGRFEVP